MKLFLCLLCLFTYSLTIGQKKINVTTQDILNFWEAYDSLSTSKDSVSTIQQLYLNRASKGLKSFAKTKKFSALEYVILIQAFPKFWESIRPNTLNIIARQGEIVSIFEQFEKRYPRFKPPEIYFTIGCLRSGGTAPRNKILIGSEIASADSSTNKSEMTGWLQSVIGNTGDIMSMIAHEAVHTQQKTSLAYIFQMMGSRLLAQSIHEGAADFVSMEIAHTTINKNVYDYGHAHLEELKTEFLSGIKSNDWSDWLYNGYTSTKRPADLGYFMGYKICEAYYQKAPDKVKALRVLMKTKNPKKIFRRSGFK